MTNNRFVKPIEEEKTVAKGALVNALGTAGGGLIAVFFILANRLYDPAVAGVFSIVFVMIQVAFNLTVSGFNDGVLMFGARFVGKSEDDDRFYDVLANGFVISIIISVLLIGLSWAGGATYLSMHYEQKGIAESIKLITLSLPFTCFTVVVISATKALLTMKWDAILLGFFKPLFLILFSLVFYLLGFALDGLLLSYLLMCIALAVISFFVFCRYFSVKKLLVHLLRFRFSMPLFKFAIPQSLNMTFNTFIANLDVLMLGYFGTSAEMISFYYMGAQTVRNIRSIKLAFSSSYAPLIARSHEEGSVEKIKETFSTVTRWTTTLALPTALVFALLRDDILILFHDSFVYDSSFMLILLVPPLLSCTVGLAGNIVVMTGHSGWNLFNSLLIAGVNALLNYILIPDYGLIGAAAATAIASLLVSILSLLELKFLLNVNLVLKKIYKPYLAILLPLALVSVCSFYGFCEGLVIRIALSLLSTGVFIAILLLLKMEEIDKQTFFSRFTKKRKCNASG